MGGMDLPRKKTIKSLTNHEKKQHEHISISTSFSGADAELIKQFAEKNQCSRPTAVRLIIRQLASGLLVTLDPKLKERMEKLISHPRIREKYGFLDVKSFIEWAINKGMTRLTEELGTLRDPSVQMSLNEDELAVAKTLLMTSQDLEHYGGVTAETIAKKTGMEKTKVETILNEFVNNGWVIFKLRNDNNIYYFPKE